MPAYVSLLVKLSIVAKKFWLREVLAKRVAKLDMVEKARWTARVLGLEVRDEVWVPGSMETPLATKKLRARAAAE